MHTAQLADSPALPRLPSRHLLGHLPAAQANLLDLFERARDRGPVVDLRMFYVDVTLVSSPEAAHQILVSQADRFGKTTRGYEVLRLLLGRGLVTAEGDYWRRQRRIANPAFRRKAVAGFVDAMVRRTQGFVDGISDGEVDVAKGMHRLALGIAGETLLSRDLSARGDVIGNALERVLPGFATLTKSPLPRPWRWPLPSTRRFLGAVRTLDTVVSEIVAARRSDLADHPDLLGMLMTATDPETGEHMTDVQLRDEVLTMLLAGHETTANALAWGLLLLAQHPEIADRVRAEVEAVTGGAAIDMSHVGQLAYTSRVFDEVLRLYPPVWVQGRRCLEETTIDGFTIPADRMVYIFTYGMHRHPALWENPDRFDPDRFLPDRRADIPRGAYHPFSLGKRKCIGDRFARTEGVAVLGTLLRGLNVDPVPGHVVTPETSITLRPHGGLPLRVSRR